MSEDKQEPAPLTNADVAKLVKREVPAVDAKGKPTGKMQKIALAEDEVFAHAVHEDGTLVVVTVDGRKLFGSVK